MVFFIYLFAVYLLPAASVGTTTLLGILVMYAFFLALVDRKLLPLLFKIFVLACMLAVFYTVLTEGTSIAQNVSNRGMKRLVSKFLQYLSLYLPMVMLLRVHKAATPRQKWILIGAALAMMVYVVITTWLYLQVDPNATREWSSFDENAEEGVANYYFIYAIPILIAVVAACFMKFRPGGKILCALINLVAVVFLVNAQYTLSILISVIGMLYQAYQSMRRTTSKVLYLLAMVLLAVFLPGMLELAMKYIPSQQIVIRLGEIHTFLVGQGAGGYNLNARLTLYTDTVRAFLASPVWGNRSLSFDGHATFLTVLADTGLLGGIPFYYLLNLTCKRICHIMGNNLKHYKTVVLMFVLMGLTNPVHASKPIALATWFLAPLMLQMILKERENNDEAI